VIDGDVRDKSEGGGDVGALAEFDEVLGESLARFLSWSRSTTIHGPRRSPRSNNQAAAEGAGS